MKANIYSVPIRVILEHFHACGLKKISPLHILLPSCIICFYFKLVDSMGLLQNVINNSSPLILLDFFFLKERKLLLALTILSKDEDLISDPSFE